MTKIHEELYQTMLRRLVQARKETGLRQVEVAEALGKPQSYVCKCEQGERRIDPVELSAFARLYQKPVTFFVE